MPALIPTPVAKAGACLGGDGDVAGELSPGSFSCGNDKTNPGAARDLVPLVPKALSRTERAVSCGRGDRPWRAPTGMASIFWKQVLLG
ncbi:Uncharacterised protein [Propionibacterium australiense]|nr:Uncharacterised protein [Propionibacterium australiense]